MDIETSKLTKTSIESPSLKTNRLVAYDDILIRNSSLGRIFGSVEPAQEVIDVRKMTDVSSYGAEQIHAFRCGVSEFTYDRIKSVTLRMSPNDNSTNSSTSQQQAVWMFVRCLDEHMNEMNDGPIISLAPVQQTSRETTWEFEPFIILSEYKVLEFRITTDKEDLNITPANYTNTLRSANLSSNNKKFYITDWKTVNQIGGVESFTTDFAIEVLRATTPFDGLMDGLNDNELKINNHINDTGDIHLTSEDRENINKIDGLNANTTSHINDANIHVTEEEKSKWNNIEVDKVDFINQSDEIPTSKAVYDELYNSETVLLNNYDTSKYGRGADTVRNVLFSKNHFVTGKIDEIIIEHDNSPSYLSNVNVDGGYLVLQLLNSDGTQMDDNIFYSDEICAYDTSSSHYKFTFSNCILPDDYSTVHIALVGDKETIPVIGSTVNERAFRIYCLTKDGNKGEGTIFEIDDECLVRNGSWNANQVCVITVKKHSKLRKEINDIENTLSNVSNEVDEIVNNHLEPIFHSLSEHISKSDKQLNVINTKIYDSIKSVQKCILDNNSLSSGLTLKDGISKVQIQSREPIEGNAILNRVIIPQYTLSDSEDFAHDTPLYLVIYGDTTGENTFDFICFSNNTQSQIKNGEDMIFTFDENINIGGYKKYRLFYTTDISSTPVEPITSEQLSSCPKMVFDSLNIDNENFVVWKTSGSVVSSCGFPAIFEYDVIEGEDLLHKDNASVHLNGEQIESLKSLSEIDSHIHNKEVHLSEDERNILIVPGYSYSNVNESDTLDNYKTHGFQLGNLHIKPGFIKQVRIPYSTYNINLEEIGGTFYLAVQVFKNGDPDTASDNKSLKETIFSINTHTISVAETSEYVFNFENLEIPNEFKFVRFMLTTSKSVLPNGYSIANCAKMRVRPVKKNGTDFREFDTDECKLLVGTGGSTQKFMAAAHFEYRPETKPIITQKISSYKWRVEAGNIDYTTLDELCDALMNTHKASIFVTAQKYNVYNYNNDFGYGDLNTTEKTNFIFEITYPKLMDVYEVVKTVYSNYYENSHYPKIYPIFN